MVLAKLHLVFMIHVILSLICLFLSIIATHTMSSLPVFHPDHWNALPCHHCPCHPDHLSPLICTTWYCHDVLYLVFPCNPDHCFCSLVTQIIFLFNPCHVDLCSLCPYHPNDYSSSPRHIDPCHLCCVLSFWTFWSPLSYSIFPWKFVEMWSFHQ